MTSDQVPALAARIGTIRRLLGMLVREVEALDAEVGRIGVGRGSSPDA